jgi:septal ring factor EnvC (AmiA/AmiB activator)
MALHRRLDEMEKLIMATFDEVKADAEATKAALADSNTRLDAVNAKIDDMAQKIVDLTAQVAAGGVVSQAQLDELGTIIAAAKAEAAGITADVADAEAS